MPKCDHSTEVDKIVCIHCRLYLHCGIKLHDELKIDVFREYHALNTKNDCLHVRLDLTNKARFSPHGNVRFDILTV